MHKIFFPGEKKLYGIYTEQDKQRLALILPPKVETKDNKSGNPQSGINYPVVNALYQAFVKAGFSTLKINCQRQNYPERQKTQSDNELIENTSVAISWLQDRNPIISEFWVAGFSFGAWMASNIIMRRLEPTGFIAVSPPVEKYDFSFLLPCFIPGLIVHGENDSVTSHLAVQKLVEKLQHKSKQTKYHCVKGGDSSFSDINHVKEIYRVTHQYIDGIVNGTSVDSEGVYERLLEEAEQ